MSSCLNVARQLTNITFLQQKDVEKMMADSHPDVRPGRNTPAESGISAGFREQSPVFAGLYSR